jgi:uroporphyrinogen-III decarboxylase
MRWSRNDYLDLMTFQPHPRPMLVELFGPLVGLEDEWRDQGATEAELDLTAFDFDYVERSPAGIRAGCRGMPETILEDSPVHQIKIDYLGRRVRLDKRTATLPLPETFPVTHMDDWLKLKPLYAFDDARIDWHQVDRARSEQQAGKLVTAGIPGSFDTLRELMGEENACVAYYDDPELVADIIGTIQDTSIRCLTAICQKLTIDQLSVHEDFAGRSGPIIGPNLIQQTFEPYYSTCWEIVRSAGGRIFQLDTDGNINSVIDALLACGLTSIFPMEPAAGMDVVQVRGKYGKRLAFAGGLDKHVLRATRADIRKELEYKLQPSVYQAGGCVWGLDHRIPNGTPIDHYRYYVDTAREILGLPPRPKSPTTWQRMAF